MNQTHLKLLRCPYCQNRLSINLLLKTKGKSVQYGSVYCKCDEFPIVEGIVWLQKDRAKHILNYLQQRQLSKALWVSLLGHRFALVDRLTPTFLWSLVGQVLSKRLLKKLGFSTVGFFLKTVKNREVINYYLNRSQEHDSLLFLLPLSFLKHDKQYVWLDIGSGVFNYYRQLHQFHPHINLISVESSFLVCYLATVFFGDAQTTFICGDIEDGIPLAPKSTNVITLIDALPFIQNQKRLVENAIATLNQNTTHFFFATAIPEHCYFDPTQVVYPTSRKLLSSFFSSTPVLLGDKQVELQILTQDSINISQALAKRKVFRYHLLWPQPKKAVYSLSSVLKKVRHQTRFSWLNHSILWRNKVY